jgi:hypothetical protein
MAIIAVKPTSAAAVDELLYHCIDCGTETSRRVKRDSDSSARGKQ